MVRLLWEPVVVCFFEKQGETRNAEKNAKADRILKLFGKIFGEMTINCYFCWHDANHRSNTYQRMKEMKEIFLANLFYRNTL